MEYVPANLSNGVLPTTTGVLYTVPTGTTLMLRSMILVNTTSAELTVGIRARFGSGAATPRCIIPPAMRLRPSNKYDDNSVIHLPAGSTIEGESSVTGVDYILSGILAS